MTLVSTLNQRQQVLHEKMLEGQLRKLPIIQEAIQHTEECGYSPNLPIEVVVDCLKDTSLFPPSKYECLGYDFIEKDGEYHIYRRVIKGINIIANEDTEWTIKDLFELYNMGAYVCNADMVFYE